MVSLGKSGEEPKQEGVAIESPGFTAEHTHYMGPERYEMLSSGILINIPKDVHGRGGYVL